LRQVTGNRHVAGEKGFGRLQRLVPLNPQGDLVPAQTAFPAHERTHLAVRAFDNRLPFRDGDDAPAVGAGEAVKRIGLLGHVEFL
jgi:hypothetical protein